MKKCCIAIITHKDALDGEDERSFIRALSVFGGKRDIKLVIPYDINTSYFDKFNYELIFEYVKVDPSWLSSPEAYNRTLCTNEFYTLFSDFEYVLIYQTDCWVFHDNIDYFLSLNHDYYGAAWPHLNDRVGNGGFSMRKVEKMLYITGKHTFDNDSIENHSDTWFCITHGDELDICDLETACNFSIEVPTEKYLKLLKSTPMGLHGNGMRKYWNKPYLLFRPR